MRESNKKSILQIDHQRGHHLQINDAVLVKIQIDLASYLKRQRCENYKENTWTIYQIYQGVNFLPKIPYNKQKCQKPWHVSQTEEGVSSLYAYPITELKMFWLIQWHLCVYRGVKVWSFSYLLLIINQVS